MSRLVKKHPRAVRWMHWINFPLLSIMIWSGLLIYWSYPAYRLGWGDTTVFKFFPTSFFQALSVPHRLAEGMAWHFVFMWLFAINGVLYVGYTIVSGEWRDLVPTRASFKDAILVTLHDLHLRKEAPPCEGKYNAAQRLAYFAIIVMGAGSLLTGLAIWRPTQASTFTTLLGGYQAARIEHFLLTIGYVAFFVVHVAQVIRAGWNNFRSMVTGYELVRTREEKPR